MRVLINSIKQIKCLMPSNTYGSRDSYDKFNSHFLPANYRKVYEAKKKHKIYNFMGKWQGKREMVFVDDIVEACIFFLEKNKRYFNKYWIWKGYENNRLCKINNEKFDCDLKLNLIKPKKDGTPRKVF